MIFREAIEDDIPFLVEMIAQDKLGREREDYKIPLPQKYLDAFNKINLDPNQELIVVENRNHEIIGTMQLSYIQYLIYQGGNPRSN